jgi:hypothetical protein
MDRKERPQSRSPYANQGEFDEGDRNVAGSSTGRVDNEGAPPGTPLGDDIRRPIGAMRRSEITGRHDEGSEANETDDGLNESDEDIRHGAEDIPVGERREDVPVFDRGGAPPKV